MIRSKVTSRFKGPLFKKAIPPMVNFLKGEFGKAALSEFKESCSKDFGNNPNLDVLRYSDEVVNGGNPYAVVLMDKVLRDKFRDDNLKEYVRLSLEGELIDLFDEFLIDNCELNLKGIVVEMGLGLYNEKGENSYLAHDLYQQIKKRTGLDLINSPLKIPYHTLELEKDHNAPHGLRFRIKEGNIEFGVPILRNMPMYDGLQRFVCLLNEYSKESENKIVSTLEDSVKEGRIIATGFNWPFIYQGCL